MRRPRLNPVRHFLRPLFDRVVVKELEPDRIRQSGLLVPAGTHEPPPQHGIVLAIGPGLDWWEGAGIGMPVKPGDHVVFPASAGAWVDVDEERLLVCRVGELLGVLDEVKDDFPALSPISRRASTAGNCGTPSGIRASSGRRSAPTSCTRARARCWSTRCSPTR